MMQFATVPSKFSQLIRDTFKSYPIILTTMWPIILVSALIHLVDMCIVGLNQYVGFAIGVFASLAMAFLYSLVLLSADATLAGKDGALKTILPTAKHRYLSLLGSYVSLIAIFAMIGALNFALLALASLPDLEHFRAIIVMICVVIDVFVFFLLLFAIPLVILTRHTVFRCYEASVKLVWNSWWRVFGVFLLITLLVLVLFILGFVVIPEHDIYIAALWSAIFHFLVYPLAVGATLVLLHDLRLRKPTVL